MHDILENNEGGDATIPSSEGATVATPPVEPTPTPAPAPEKVEVDAALLKRILDQNESLEKRLVDQQSEFAKQIEILRDSVSRGKLEEAEGKRKPAEKPRAFLARYNGKVVVGWKAEKNEYVYNPMNPNTVAGEILTTRLYYLDGSSSEPIPQVFFTKNDDRVFIRKVGEKRNEDGALTSWVVEFEDASIEPRTIEIHPQFLNPV